MEMDRESSRLPGLASRVRVGGVRGGVGCAGWADACRFEDGVPDALGARLTTEDGGAGEVEADEIWERAVLGGITQVS